MKPKKPQMLTGRRFVETQDSGGPPYLKGVKMYKLKKVGKISIDVIPYVVGKGNPSADEGYGYYERKFWVHRGIGPDGKDGCICNAKTFNTRCLVCEHITQAKRNGASDEELKEMKVKQRHIFRFLDAEDPDAGIQVYECGFYMSFGEQLSNKINAAEEYETFADLTDGKRLVMSVQEKNGNIGSYKSITNIEMVPRKKPLPESLIDEGPNLDDIIKPAEKAVVRKLLTMETDDEPEVDHEADTSSPVKRKSAPPPDIDEDDEEETPPAKPAKKAAAPADDEDEEEEPAPKLKPSAKKSAPVDDDDEEEEEAPPAKPAKKAAAKPADDDDDDYGDDDDLPARKPAAKAKR